MIPLRHQITWTRRFQRVLAGVAVCGLAAFYFIAYRPVSQHMADLRIKTVAANDNINRNEEAARDLDAIKSDVRRLKDQITRSRQLPSQEDLPNFIREITQLSQGVSLQQFKFEPRAPARRELCGESPIDLTFAGKFPDIAAFLRQAEEMPRMMRTRRLEVKSNNGKAGDVDVKVSMSIFYADAK